MDSGILDVYNREIRNALLANRARLTSLRSYSEQVTDSISVVSDLPTRLRHQILGNNCIHWVNGFDMTQ